MHSKTARCRNHGVARYAGLGLSLAIVTLFFSAPAAATDPSGPGLTVFGLTADQQLVKFRSDRPRRARNVGPITGLNARDTALVGIDFRVQDGQLYGLGNGGGIYTIDTRTGIANFQFSLTEPLVGTFFGVDFNPAANALRIVSDTGQNLRQPFPAPGATPPPTAVDGTLTYPATPTTPATTAIGVTGAAYTNNDLDPATATTLFDIDSQRNQVVIQSPANAGLLVATGSLTVDPDTPVGFDIYSKLGRGVTIQNSAFASLVVGGVSRFYSVNLLTGRAFPINGAFRVPIADIAVALQQ